MRRLLLVVAVALVGALVVAPAEGATNDTLFAQQWGLRQVRAEQAWPTSRGAGITIAIVDSGIDLDHPDLASKVIPGITFLGCGSAGCGNGDWQTGPLARRVHDSPHGTHVAGIAGAITGNGAGIAGIAPDAKLLAVKVIDADGGSFADIALGIRYAADRGAHVINLSLGVEGPDQIRGTITGFPADLANAIKYAQGKGVVVVAAAGNDTLPVCSEPALEPGVVCVAATDKREARSYYSNFPSTPGDFLPLSAPGGSGTPVCGEDVVSTVPQGINECSYGGLYREFAGTSMAAPHVSGVVALLAAQGRSRDGILQVLRTTSRQPTGARGQYDPVYGFGIVDAEAAVAAAGAGSGSGTTTTTTAPGSSTSTTSTTASAGTRDPVDRLAGEDRVATAIAISGASFTSGSAASAVLARADAFADALAGAPLADDVRGPLLLTPSTQLDSRVEAELHRVVPEGATVHLLGGEGALSRVVEEEVRALGYTPVRHSGDDRYATAVAVARHLGDPATLLLTTGTDHADALSAGAAAAKVDGAVLLTNDSSMPAATAQYLSGRSGTTRYAVGGPAATADREAEAIVGADRFDTSRRVAERFFGGAPANVGVASGVAFADALAGGAHAARRGGPLLLSGPGELPESVRTYLAARRSSIIRGFLYGGEASLSEAVRVAVADAIT